MLALMVAQAYQARSRPIDPLQHVVVFNPTYEQLWAPIVGPAHPYTKDGIAQGMHNHKLGFVEDTSIEPFIFDEQYYTLHKYGYAPDPSASAGNNYVGDLDALQKNDAISVYNIPQHEQKKRKIEKKETEKEEANGHEENLNKVELQNPASDTWLMKNRKSPWAGKKEGLQTELTDEQKKYAEEYAKRRREREAVKKRERFFQIKVHSMVKKREIIKEGLGLHLPRMPRPTTIIVIYRRDWCTLGVATRRACLQ